MLFDLRSRRRRHVVRIVYALLALIMLAGLLLVGVGTGNNNGGLLNAFTNNGSGSSSSQVESQQTRAALKLVKAHPDSPAAYYQLMLARWSDAQNNVDTTTSTYTKKGLADLHLAVTAWQKYLSVEKTPDLSASLLSARVYEALAQWGNASTSWQYEIQTQPKGSTYALKGYECVALNAYAAKRPSQGDLAAAAALAAIPKAQQLQWKTTFKSAKKSQTTAEDSVASSC